MINRVIGGGNLPSYISQNKNIISLGVKQSGRPYRDNLCLFRCLALKLAPGYDLEESCSAFYRRISLVSGLRRNYKKCRGITLNN